jgi:hypothetical protein
MSELKDVAKLLRQLPLRTGEQLPPGAPDSELDLFSGRTGIQLPTAVRAWLNLSNGAGVGPKAMLGVKTRDRYRDIEYVYKFAPLWKENGWIPLTSDGSGNYYLVVPTRGQYPVVFVDVSVDPEKPTYVVASNPLRFLRFLFEDELGLEGWPFNPEYVESRDPEIRAFYDDFAAPWAA